jgi:hypothetical protein
MKKLFVVLVALLAITSIAYAATEVQWSRTCANQNHLKIFFDQEDHFDIKCIETGAPNWDEICYGEIVNLERLPGGEVEVVCSDILPTPTPTPEPTCSLFEMNLALEDPWGNTFGVPGYLPTGLMWHMTNGDSSVYDIDTISAEWTNDGIGTDSLLYFVNFGGFETWWFNEIYGDVNNPETSPVFAEKTELRGDTTIQGGEEAWFTLAFLGLIDPQEYYSTTVTFTNGCEVSGAFHWDGPEPPPTPSPTQTPIPTPEGD